MKKIGITQRLAIQENYREKREILDIRWGEFCWRNKILPIPVSYAVPIHFYLQEIDGVILSGGNDLSSVCDDECSLQRDIYERDVISQCLEKRIPLLGICRGAQLIAEYFHSKIVKVNGHIAPHQIVWHDNHQSLQVNSYHYYAIKRLGCDLRAMATSCDGYIEAFVHKQYPIFGAMWHPEREGDVISESSEIFFNFFLRSL